ncbi:30S ribosomal protein S2 [Bacteroidota bacterium]
MSRTNFNELLKAGVHFGHLKRKWNPSMAPYIFMEKNGIHILDLHKTIKKIDEASAAIKQIAISGRKILFVATKKQAKELVSEKVKAINMPYITERWSGGMLTNFPTIRKAIKKMTSIDKMSVDGTFKHLSKRERLQITRQRAKLEKILGSIKDLTRLPAALFVVDISKERIAVAEAVKLGIPVFGIVDTNSDPSNIDFPIPANDDASKSISLIMDIMCTSIMEGLIERKNEREKESANKIRKSEKNKIKTDDKINDKKEETTVKSETKEEVSKEEVTKEEVIEEEVTKEEVIEEEVIEEEVIEEKPIEEKPEISDSKE